MLRQLAPFPLESSWEEIVMMFLKALLTLWAFSYIEASHFLGGNISPSPTNNVNEVRIRCFQSYIRLSIEAGVRLKQVIVSSFLYMYCYGFCCEKPTYTSILAFTL